MIDKIPKVLTFSATDPTFGAGMQADIITLSSLGCHPLTIVTGVSVQDTIGVESLTAISEKLVNSQARTILKDMEVSVFKCGVLGSVENIKTVAKITSDYPEIPLIIDPVLASGRGDNFANAEMISAMKELLLPNTYLSTPNSNEAKKLVIQAEENLEDLSIDLCAERLKIIGCKNILITGTHENTSKVVNTFYESSGEIYPFYWDRLKGNYHGSGCTLTSAISGYLAQGLSLKISIEKAQYFTWQALKNAFKPGRGQYIPNRLFSSKMI